MAHKLPPLRFGYDALEPYIDTETMELHHDKHHATYVDNLNKALEPYPQLVDLAVEDLLRRLDQVPEAIRTTVRNNAGGHVNHQLFWDILGPPANGSPIATSCCSAPCAPTARPGSARWSATSSATRSAPA